MTTNGFTPSALQDKLWRSLIPPVLPAYTDTYKRTMGVAYANPNELAAYGVAFRKAFGGMPMVVAGLESALLPWFMDPVGREAVEAARLFQTTHSAVNVFPNEIWDHVLANGGKLPIDVWALPGGQTILGNVPHMSLEGPGGLVSYLEPHILGAQHFATIVASKARHIKDEVGVFAEFGMRSARTWQEHIILLLGMFVGAGFRLTSNDMAEMMFPGIFKAIGTMGHEFIMSFQRNGVSLEEAQLAAFRAFVSTNRRSALLPDILHTTKSGLPAILKVKDENRGNGKVIIPRFDSGNIEADTVSGRHMWIARGYDDPFVVEDGITDMRARAISDAYRSGTGRDPKKDLVFGAGGYFQNDNTRDAVSAAFKRTATGSDGHIKIPSDSPGKRTYPGYLRVLARGETLVVCQAEEVGRLDGVPLMVKVVDKGRYVYDESFEDQAARADATWEKYDHVEMSPLTQAMTNRFVADRDKTLSRL